MQPDLLADLIFKDFVKMIVEEHVSESMSRMIIWVLKQVAGEEVEAGEEAGVSFCKAPSLELGSKNLFKELYIELKPLERDDNQLWPGASVPVTCATTLPCSRIRSLCGRTAKVVGSNPNQAWNGWNVLSGGTAAALESRGDHTGHPRASWAWSMACLRAKKFLIFHHSAPFVMENCTIYQTSGTSLWEDLWRKQFKI